MVVVFSLINNWGYKQINVSNELGVTPGFCLDLFGFNLLVMVSYCFTNKALKLYYLVPLYALYRLYKTVGPYLSMLCPQFFGRGAKYDEHDAPDDGKSNRQKKREK